ncbi:MAG: tetratricopeptide repeat protein [Flavobacteriales bacterium]|nr:tetratricopeptide repeat protein [Flavobacteriales bacterium]
MRQLFVLIVVLICHVPTGMAQHFTWNEEAREAYALLLDLRFQKADSVLKVLEKRDADNLCAPYLRDLADFLYIVVQEDGQEYERRSKLKDKRLAAFERAAHNDPFKNIALGETYLHWAFADMRFGNYFSGAMGIRKAFQLLEENAQRFPSFIQTYKSMGLLHTLVGTVPDNYRWAAKLMGVDGTISQGIDEMQRVIRGNSGRLEFIYVRKETLFLFTFLQLNLVNDDEAVRSLQKHLAKHTGPLMDFAKARVLQRTGDTDGAIDLLGRSLAKRPNAFPYLQFLLGDMKLARLDADADRPFHTYLRIFKGKSYLKASRQKLGWHALLVNNDRKSYTQHLAAVKTVGNTSVDEDRAAQKEAESGVIPNQTLLKARMMFDGGYYARALKDLENASADRFVSAEERLERQYRLGRIHHEMGNHQKAVEAYRATMRDGASSTRYFAANAALQLGLLYEKLGDKEKAREAFASCSTFKNTEYRDSINQKAKAGLNRL